jgi:hypothetical protein
MSGKGSKQRPTNKVKFDVNYDRIFGKEKNDRVVRTLAENSKNKSMTRKVDTYEYETLEECIKSEQVPPSEIAEIFTDKEYYKWYAKRNFK